MSSQFVNLDSLFDGPQDAPQPRGIGRSSSVDLDSIFRTSEEAKGDVRIGKYRFAGTPEAKLEAPERRGIGQRIDDTITDVFGTNVPNPEDIRPEGIARVKAEEAQDQEIIQRRRAELGTDSPDRGTVMRSIDSLAGGAAGMSGSVLEYLGRQFGSETIEQLGKSASLEAAALTPENQNLFEKVMGGVGSAVPLVTGGVVSAIGGLKVGLGLKGSMVLASGVSAVLESAAIAQEAYEGALKETGNEARAETQGYKAGVLNVPLSFIANKIGIFGSGGGRIRQTGKTILTEGAEEGTQKGLTNYLGYQPTGEGVSEEALIGGLTGGVIKQFTFTPDRQAPQPVTDGTSPGREGERAPEGAPASPVPESELPEGVRNLGFQEVYQTLRTNPAVAAVMYQEATTQEQKQLVLKAVDRAEIQREFKDVLGDPNLLADTRRQMQEFPEFTDSLAVSIKPFVENMPPANIFKAERRTPSETEVANEFEQAWEDAGFQAELEQDAATLLLEAEERQQNRRPAFQAEQSQVSLPDPEAPAEAATAESALTIPYDTVSFAGVGQPLARSSGESPVINIGGRMVVMRMVNGVRVPFYLSTGSGGKKDVPAGKWYPFFGIGADGWINKTGGSDMTGYYGSQALRDAASELDSSIGDIRSDNSIPKAAPTGRHIDFINQGFSPTENGNKDTLSRVQENISKLVQQVESASPQSTSAATETSIEDAVASVEADARQQTQAQAETFNASEATQLNDQNRAGFEAYFGDIADQVAILQNPEVKKEAYEGALTQMTEIGFTEQQARAILDAGQPQVEPATGKAGLFQQASTLLAVRNRDDSAAFQPAKLPAYFNDIAKALGVDVVAYTYNGSNETSANRAGTYMRGPSGRGLVAINLSKSQDGALFVLGHEVFHDFQRRFPAQAKQLAQEVKRYVQAERVQVYEQYYGERKQSDKTDGEIAADVMGQMFTDRQFWQSLSQKRPGLVQRVIQIIDSVIAKFRGSSNRMEIARYINQYEQVRDMMASFVADNMARPQGSRSQVRFTEEREGEMFSPSAQMSFGDLTITRDGMGVSIEFGAPVSVGDVRLQAANINSERTRFLASAPRGDVSISVDDGYIEISSILSDKFSRISRKDGAGASARDEAAIRRALGDNVVNAFFAAKDGETQDVVTRSLVGRDLSNEIASVTSAFEQRYLSPPSEAMDDFGDQPVRKTRPAPPPERLFAPLDDAPAPAAQPRQATQRPSGTSQIVDQVVDLLRLKKFAQAGNLFRENNLQAQGLTLGDLQKRATSVRKTVTVADEQGRPARADERRRFGGNVQAAQVARPDLSTDETPDLSFSTPAKKPKKTTAKKAESRQIDPDRGVQFSLGLGLLTRQSDAPPAQRLRNKLDSLIRGATNVRFFEETVSLLNKQIADIDRRLQEITSIEVDGKTFVARNEEDAMPGLWGIYDENAYDRMEDGFVADKPTTKSELLAARRKLTGELEEVGFSNARQKARVLKNVQNRLRYDMIVNTEGAIDAGMPRQEAYEILNSYFGAMSTLNTSQRADFVAGQETEAGVVEQGIQDDAFVGERAAMGLAADFKSKAITNRQLESLIDEGLREGDFNHMDLAKAFNAYNVSLPRGVLNTSSQLSVRKRLKDFLSENGNTTAARMEWMVNMEKVVGLNPGALSSKFTADEVAYYNLWKQDRQALRSRRKVTDDMRVAKTAEEAFPNLMFNRFRLSQVRNPELIQESESTRSAVRAIAGGDPDTVYFEDVAYALRRRPDLETDIFESMTADEGRQFRDWVDTKKRAVEQESKMLAKAEAFTTLRNLGHADAILGMPDPILTSEPGRAEGAPDTSPKERERIYARLVNAELNEMPAIMDSMARLNSMLNGRIDPETGEIMTDAQAEQAAADYVDSLLQKSLMSSAIDPKTGAEMTQYGATMGFGDDAPAGLRRGEFGFGETVEQAGDAMRATGPQFTSELSTEEQLQNEQLSEAEFADLAGRLNAEADAEIEGRTAPETEVAQDRADRAIRNEIPGSLVGDKDYRFRHAPFSGELTNSIVAEHVLKISSKWPGAPRINVLPNVQMLPAELREKVMARLTKDFGAAGLFYNGEVYLFSDHLTSLSDAEFTLFHETYGHYGMRAFLGNQFDDFLQRAYNTNTRIKAEVDALMADKPIGLLEAVDEVLSDMAATNQPVSLVKQWMGRVIAGLRDIGMTRVSGWLSTKTDAEIGYTLAMARRAVQEGGPAIFNGAPGDVRLAEARLPYEMFSSKGGETTAYTRYNPVTQTYAVFTATGKNIRDGWETQVVDKFEDAIDLMRKQGKVERRLRSGLYIDNKIPSDLQKLPDFMNDTTDLSFTSIADLKKRGQNIWRSSVMYFQNEYKPVMMVVDHLRSKGRMADSFDPTNDLDGLHERRTASALQDMKRRIVQPLMELVKEGGPVLGKTLNDSGLNLPAGVLERIGSSTVLDAYLIAKHAAERNKHIAGINPNMKDGGSGMFTADADAVLNALRGQKVLPKLEEISVLLQQLSNEKLTVMRESGMISHDEFMARAKYKNYVNLSGFKDGLDGFDDLQVLSGSSKLSTRKDKRALGRGDVTAEVLARTIQSAQAALLNSSKNRLKQKILAMFEVNYDPDFVAINKQPYKRVLDENGEVTEKIDESYIRNKNVMVVHVNGRPVTIEFKKVGNGTFADAIHGAIYPSQSENFLLQASGQFNRIIGQMLTTWNPAWTLVNFTRDAQTLYFNSVADKRVSEKMARDMFKSLPKAMQATANVFTDGRRYAKADQGMIDAFIEMREVGGATTFMNFQGLDRQVQDIQDMIRPDQVSTFKKGATFITDRLEAFNMPIELAPRLAAYKVLRDNGWSKESAAQYAGEITVNFNLRGSSKLMRNLYLFFNPAIQGSAKIGKLMVSNPKTFSSIAMGMVLTGFMSSIYARMLGGEDEDGVDKIDKIPFFKRAFSLAIPNPLSTGDRPFITIPVPYGWNAFFAAGTFMADRFFGDTSPQHTSKRIFEAAFEGFSPIGNAGLDSQTWSGVIAKGLAPTATLPLVEMMFNENRFGAPLVKEASMYGGGMRPNAEMAFDSVSPISAGIFKGLNRATGGDYVNPGTIDINPGIVDHMIRSYIPGLGAEAYSLASWATRQAIGQETKTATVPLFDRFVGKIPQGYDYGMYRRAKEEISTRYDDFRLNESRRDTVLEEFPELGAARGVITTTDSRMQDLRQYRQTIMRDESLSRGERMEIYNQTREREREIINTAVRTLLEIRPELKPTMIASE